MRITRGQFRSVSEVKLLELVARLVHDVKFVVGRRTFVIAINQPVAGSR